MASLWADVYMFTCSTMPEPSESFKAETRLPWNGEYRHIKDDRDLQDLFNHLRENKTGTMRIDVVLISLATMPQLASCPQELRNPIPEDSANQRGSSEDSEDEDYMPYTSKIAKSTDTSNNSYHDSTTSINKGNGNATLGLSDNSNDDHLSNAISFDYDLNNMVDSRSDKEEGNSRPHISRKGKPYKKAKGGKVVLEVGQLFNNLQHFRQVLGDFMVQEGFELKRIKNDKERYTAKCAYEGCSWRIHTSHVDDKTTFMIKTMQVRHGYHKVHKNQEATTVWVTRRFKPLIEENLDIDVKFLGCEIHHIYEVMVGWIRDGSQACSDVGMIINDVGSMLHSSNCAAVKYVLRKANQVAHFFFLAKSALSSDGDSYWPE
ncbi:hypothetical protein Q3G72_015256 [Acer saccharum]|nr:hypothetical protein Q3G72_015256 [Acer saccharum]